MNHFTAIERWILPSSSPSTSPTDLPLFRLFHTSPDTIDTDHHDFRPQHRLPLAIVAPREVTSPASRRSVSSLRLSLCPRFRVRQVASKDCPCDRRLELWRGRRSETDRLLGLRQSTKAIAAYSEAPTEFPAVCLLSRPRYIQRCVPSSGIVVCAALGPSTARFLRLSP